MKWSGLRNRYLVIGGSEVGRDSLQMYAKQINRKGTTAEHLELEERYLGNIDVTKLLEEVPGWQNSDKDHDAEDINLSDLLGSFDGNDEPIERRKLVLPFNSGKSTCKIEGLHHLIHILLGQKSFLFRTKVRVAWGSQKKKLKAWAEVTHVKADVKVHSAIYKRAWHAIISLGSWAEILQKYQELKPDHLKT
ncbi:hypothetical protein SERLA73DRAFT_149101 [Serpula lacrymans var. lacrymans S7.3]|uniref:Uncharacterized protein n=2 Tax=Serpula lacrymans var. lacrymans TaxID=341189 RepID=F8PF20_SERL3|nr:uncharacterized protein SERLADRAFT_404669 [Serpula lacrymans var. lacrymans S7.9]EGO04693.1 hypothetical protein SERLA73DRAFT_149101 [Serpula lacrymans var. lacrymans S7.3]EGO30542.1 hypothetical protein SERLADRAFT_404669 [Serpula lacrymans var. lacrymans S7.9]